MRRQNILLLFVALYFAAVDVATDLQITFDSTDSVRIPTRLLRAQESADVGNVNNAFPAEGEERGGNGAWVSGLAELDKKASRLRKFGMRFTRYYAAKSLKTSWPSPSNP
ncbi:hypothetical protein PHYSODRAFT_284038 [Phytophthora sojae]|uniref:RxLR effector protein n=2 Tax=Phytophthora sojae TaxID=67593 RepID=G4YFK4_PHYSP|nr:hypothetical protein PHYSODRAFT_284038 [Phytophthora sojae]AEK81394.1 Avh465 [Phytophthora sojae]EGZ26989.1 hypothetical protein PHYSODRAFT_284038 [Phytophthora sojae]|eukprot:XP_009514264.1 hypothetical protein PHYSODRAFT_284038 [Phytophthora sojae]